MLRKEIPEVESRIGKYHKTIKKIHDKGKIQPSSYFNLNIIVLLFPFLFKNENVFLIKTLFRFIN